MCTRQPHLWNSQPAIASAFTASTSFPPLILRWCHHHRTKGQRQIVDLMGFQSLPCLVWKFRVLRSPPHWSIALRQQGDANSHYVIPLREGAWRQNCINSSRLRLQSTPRACWQNICNPVHQELNQCWNHLLTALTDLRFHLWRPENI